MAVDTYLTVDVVLRNHLPLVILDVSPLGNTIAWLLREAIRVQGGDQVLRHLGGGVVIERNAKRTIVGCCRHEERKTREGKKRKECWLLGAWSTKKKRRERELRLGTRKAFDSKCRGADQGGGLIGTLSPSLCKQRWLTGTG